MSFLEEIKRRKVFRVGIGYIIAAWLVAQVGDLVALDFRCRPCHDLLASFVRVLDTDGPLDRLMWAAAYGRKPT